MTTPTDAAAPPWTPRYTRPGELNPIIDTSTTGDRTIAETVTWNYTVEGITYTDHITADEAVARLWAIAAETSNTRTLREQAADLAEDFAKRLPQLPGEHRHGGLLCQVPVFNTGGVLIVPHWPKSLTNHGWTCLNCDTQFSDNGYGATMAALFVHAHTCGHPRYGLPLGRQVRESVWEQIGEDTGWTTALTAAEFNAAEIQAAHERTDTGHQRELEEVHKGYTADLEAQKDLTNAAWATHDAAAADAKTFRRQRNLVLACAAVVIIALTVAYIAS